MVWPRVVKYGLLSVFQNKAWRRACLVMRNANSL